MTRFSPLALFALGLCALSMPALAAPRPLYPLLQESSRPPLFTLPDTAGQTVRLNTYLGRKRIVVLAVPAGTERQGAEFLRAAMRHRAEFAARDLVVLALTTAQSGLFKEFNAPPFYTLHDDGGEIARAYGGSPHAPAFYLVGKDGGIKMARRTVPTLRELFGTIDAMPMRRAEMRRRGE